MRITGFFVNNFGIFSGGGADLSKGLTVIHGENESGKTTLMNFSAGSCFPVRRVPVSGETPTILYWEETMAVPRGSAWRTAAVSINAGRHEKYHCPR